MLFLFLFGLIRVSALKGLVREDFQFIEQKVSEKYPNASLIGKALLKNFIAKIQGPKYLY